MADAPTATAASPAAPRTPPQAQCDVVMKGGITSGVVYPKALRVLGTHYRFRGVGGASAGAIGATLGAAAEYGRSQGGFDTLDGLPERLGDERLARLFQPQRPTRKLLDMMLVATGSDRTTRRAGVRKLAAIPWRAAKSFWLAGLVGVTPGVVCVVIGARDPGLTGWFLVGAGIVIAVVGWVGAILARLYRLMTVAIPGNMFGICTGLSEGDGPGFTDWLSSCIDEIAGTEASAAPLTFGQLWAGSDGSGSPTSRSIDLRLITTCLSEGTPFELPFEADRFYFDPDEWRKLFPKNVMDALLASESAVTEEAGGRTLVRLPKAAELPVIVATRLSLSFPLLISAVPLHTKDRRRASDAAPGPDGGFLKLWFTDGGFCSNFPVQLFDAALASRPTYAINLGSFDSGVEPDPDDQKKNIDWARNNNDGLLPSYTAIAETGPAAVTGFASAAFNTARNWQDNAQLRYPGYRDRIVRVLQSKTEGGMNLRMGAKTICGLAERGETAASVMVDQFTEPHYGNYTGWDNHRWLRYRALLSVMPDWIASFRRGLAVLAIVPDTAPDSAPSYRFTSAAQVDLAGEMTAALSELGDVVARASANDPAAVDGVVGEPNPRGQLRRVPRI